MSKREPEDSMAAYRAGKIATQGYPGIPGGQPFWPNTTIPGVVPGVLPQPVLDEVQKPAVYMDKTSEKSVTLEFVNLPNEDAVEIVSKLLPDILERFLRKNAEYGADELKLGPKAEFVRIWNKVRKLKQLLWDGKATDYEQTDEVIDDFIGHLLLARLGLRD